MKTTLIEQQVIPGFSCLKMKEELQSPWNDMVSGLSEEEILRLLAAKRDEIAVSIPEHIIRTNCREKN